MEVFVIEASEGLLHEGEGGEHRDSFLVLRREDRTKIWECQIIST